jgi:hypothetical protein
MRDCTPAASRERDYWPITSMVVAFGGWQSRLVRNDLIAYGLSLSSARQKGREAEFARVVAFGLFFLKLPGNLRCCRITKKAF